MASSSGPASTAGSNKIFAPAGSNKTGQADQYLKGALERDALDPSPLEQFHKWFREANEAGVYQPETVCLSTASLPSGAVSSRFVYLKELDQKGFVIYSNWGTSRKAADVASNPQASLAFWWHEMERQVRVEGRCERLTNQESQRYYDVRARGSKIGAWASPQSSILKDRAQLDNYVADVNHRFKDTKDADIPVPDFWGGLRVIPTKLEFWQGRESRLHDRFQYVPIEGESSVKSHKDWKLERLSP